MRYVVSETELFSRWLSGLRDERAKAAVARRIDRLQRGNFGDSKSVGEGVSELRIDIGPGYRVYYVPRGTVLIVLLSGGDKGSQRRDIKVAQALAKEI